MQIKDVMSRDVVLTHPDAALIEAARKMREQDVGMLPIGEDKRLIGTITDRDIIVRAVADGIDPREGTVRQAMSKGLVYCYDDQPLEEASALMSQHQVRRLPVIGRDRRLVGIVALGDLARSGEDQATDEASAALAGVSAQPH